MLKSWNRISQRRKEWLAVESLKKNDSIMVFPAEKRRVMNKMDYIKNCNDLLKDTKTYKKLKRDPTSGYKDEFIAVMADLKEQKVISSTLHKALYPTTDHLPWFYGLPKIHKTTICMSLQPIGMIFYKIAQYQRKPIPHWSE